MDLCRSALVSATGRPAGAGSNGVRFRTFNVLDDFNREALAIEIDTSLPSRRLVRAFEQLKAERGLSDVLHTDNGPV